MKPILQVKQLSIWLKSQVVNNISFDLHPEETLALVGESGAGKSITVMSIIRLLPNIAEYGRDSQLLLGNQDLLLLPENKMRKIRGHRIAMIFQDPMTSLNPVMNIASQIGESLSLHQGLTGKAQILEAAKLLTAVNIDDSVRVLKSYPHELSGGMKQRVMIAIALAGKPDILLADEPTTALDVTTQAQVLQLLKNLQQKYKMAMIFITHDLTVAAQISDNIKIMYNGEIVPETHTYSKKLFNVHKELQTATADLAAIGNNKILEIIDAKIYFPKHKVKAVDGVSLTLNAGETLGIVGTSGSGKTTLGYSLVGLHKLTAGEIKLFNIKPQDIQIIFQDHYSAMDPRMRVLDIIMEAMHRQKISKQEKIVYIENLVRQVELPLDTIWRYPHEFSGGQRQRICIARALAAKPRVIVCDEPTSSLDVSIQAQILKLLINLQKEHKLSYIFITHDMNVIKYMAHNIAVMEKGSINGSVANPALVVQSY